MRMLNTYNSYGLIVHYGLTKFLLLDLF
ncbi:unnamed protein product, partial [Vitis vinifera]|uniref:Uncharacterized protein n=1 Tax=Vitis vinifera TaxID=29760 RepID=D7TYU9_VITVI